MNWYRRAQEARVNMAKMYHITNPFSAQKIMENGFDPNFLKSGNSFSFTTKEGIKKWARLLQEERTNKSRGSLYMGLNYNIIEALPLENEAWKNVKIIEVTIPQSTYDKLHRLGDEIFYKGYSEKYESDQGGYIKRNIVPLKNGVNCTMRLLSDEEVHELV